MVLGNSQKNKWCAFCKYWHDPGRKALTPKTGKNFYSVDNQARCKCSQKNLITPALSTCSKFKNKF